jgi:hypothetical protein
VEAAALEDKPYRMEDADELTAARRTLGRPFVVEAVLDLVGLAA